MKELKLGSEILWLSETDVASLLTIKEAMESVESAFLLHGKGLTQMPKKIYLEFNPFGGDLRAMPGYLMDKPFRAGVKIVNSNPKNPEKKLPAVSGIMVVVDPETGLVSALMAAGQLTNIRTGAAGGIAAKQLALPNSTRVGLVGAGKQAQTQMEALMENFQLKEVFVWGKTVEEAQAFCQTNRKKFDIKFYAHSKVKDVCDADIIVTTTPSREALVQTDWVRAGTHVNAIGADAPGKQELSLSLLKLAKIYVDEWGQASLAGEINKAVSSGKFTRKDIVGELSQLLTGDVPGRKSNSDITIFDSTGLAIQDVAVANLIFQKALKLNKGQVLKFQ